MIHEGKMLTSARESFKRNLKLVRNNISFYRGIFGLHYESKEQKYVLKKTINASADSVYNVISEVSKYKDFIPYCEESFVSKRHHITQEPTEAGLKVEFQQYDERFICKVECNLNMKTVISESLSHNIFDVLYSKWTITPHPQRSCASEVELLLRFKFKSQLYNQISSIFAKSVTELVMKSFERRIFQLKKEDVKSDLL